MEADLSTLNLLLELIFFLLLILLQIQATKIPLFALVTLSLDFQIHVL